MLLITIFINTLIYLPTCTTSCIIIYIASSLIDIQDIYFMYRTKQYIDLMICISMTLITIIFGIDVAILAGIIICLFIIVKQQSNTQYTFLYRINQYSKYNEIYTLDNVNIQYNHNNNDYDNVLLLYRIDSNLYSYTSEKFKGLSRYVHNKYQFIKTVILNCSLLQQVDTTALHVLVEIIEYYNKHNIHVILIINNRKLIKLFYTSNIITLVGSNNMYNTYNDLLQLLNNNTKHDQSTHMSQHSISLLDNQDNIDTVDIGRKHGVIET